MGSTSWYLIQSLIKKKEWPSLIPSFNHVSEFLAMMSDVSLDEWEAFFNQIVVRRVWGKVDKLATTSASQIMYRHNIWKDLLCFTKFFHSKDMMYSVIVNDQNTLGAQVWIHFAHEALQILQKLLSIVPTYFDVTIDDFINCNCWQQGVSMVSSKSEWAIQW